MANNSMLMPLKIERQFSGALDANYEFETLEELKNYASTSPLSYSGQILYCKENDTLYKVNNDKTDVTSLGGGAAIDDTTTSLDSTWSSEKIANNYSTKEYVAEQISNAVHLVKEIVDEIPLAENAKENVIYMIKDDTVTSGDIYKEYQLINGEVVQTGDTSIDLTEYAKTTDIPTKVSQLENDSNYLSSIPEEYVTETELNAKGYLTSHQDISGLQTKTDDKLATTSKEVVGAINELKKGVSSISVPTKVSQLTNDKGYLSSVPSEYVTEAKLNAKGYLTEHQDISNLALKSEIPDVSSFITSEDLPTVPTKVSELTNDKNYISSIPSEYVTETELKAKGYLTSVPSTYALKTDIPTVPTKTSQLTNDSKFITSIPAEYITETELKAKGYLTSHQDISGLQTKTDKNLVTTSKEVVGAINEVKSLNDTKLNKTDANKLDCVTIDNVSLKEYILTNFTEIGKTYYLIAKTTCTDLPKTSNFYITVETPGLYTYKVTAKELNDSNGKYVCTYRTISSSWSDWEKVLSSSDITDTIDINSSDIKIPTVKAIYDDVIEGKEIDQTVIDKYGTEILKYPLGIWRISNNDISNIFSDLPVKISGRIEITSIDAATNKNPWNNNWSYRTYNFETFNKMNYFRKITSGNAIGVKTDTGWQKVCATTVEDVGVTTITPVNSAITGTIEYTVKNGICYVSMKNVNSTTNTDDLSISTTMPKSSIDCGFSLIAKGSKGNIGFLYIGKNTTKLNGNFWVAGVSGNCSFSYPVAES